MSVADDFDLKDLQEDHQRALDALLKISYAVGSVMELPEILRRIVKETARLMEADVCSIYLLEKDSQQLRLRATHGLNPEAVDVAVIPVGRGIVGWVVEKGEVLALSDAVYDSRFEPIEGTGEEDLHAFLCVPLRIQSHLVGAMSARWLSVRDISPADVTLFETICKQITIVIEKARLYHEKVEAERLAAVAVGLSEIAHYIKNLLTSVEGGVFIVDKALKAGDLNRAQKGWELLVRNNRKIADLVANMLSYSRQEEMTMVPIDINLILHDVIESALARTDRNEIQIVESYEPNLPLVSVDAEALHDCFLNLVTNAIDAFGPGGGVVVVGSRNLAKERKVMVEVIDTGQGIPEAIQDKVFNLFFSTKGSKGTGIGLAATKKKIEAHGGTVDFESKEGKGTTFRVMLPLSEDAVAGEEILQALEETTS